MASLAITIKTTEKLDNVHTVRDSVKGFYACIVYILKKWRFGRVLPIPHKHTQTLEYNATQLV